MKKPKLTTQERNQLIFERQKNGEDVRAIANEYRISVGMVKRIVQHIHHKHLDAAAEILRNRRAIAKLGFDVSGAA